MAPFQPRDWIASLRLSKLSAWAGVLFAVTIVFPWCVFAWLTLADRTTKTASVERNLQALATAYADHATTLLRLDAAAGSGSAQGTAGMEKELASFGNALKALGVSFTVHGIGAQNPDAAGDRLPAVAKGPRPESHAAEKITVEVERPLAGIAVTASVEKSQVLADWRERTFEQAIALCLRTLVVIAVGLFVIDQLRRREHAEAELVSARKAAESASRAKSEFLANMSHELRTPLNAILGFSEIIKNRTFGPVNERYGNYAGDIFNSGTHLLSLINDILNLSKLEAGQLTLDEDDIDLRTTVEDCVSLLENQARQSKVRLSMSFDEASYLVRADDRRLRQILINLLSNAVKFTPAGGEVRVTSVKRKDGLTISVSDTGIGIAPEDIPKALAPFGQVNSKVRRRFEGTGLGLPLAKQLVELHGGTFSIESKINAGTTVSFVLPAERIAATRTRSAAALAIA